MAEGSGGVSVTHARGPRAPREIEGEIRRRRGELGALAAELNRRRRELTNPNLLLRRHALGVTVALLSVGAVAAGSIAACPSAAATSSPSSRRPSTRWRTSFAPASRSSSFSENGFEIRSAVPAS